jgi:hypothetical protein
MVAERHRDNNRFVRAPFEPGVALNVLKWAASKANDSWEYGNEAQDAEKKGRLRALYEHRATVNKAPTREAGAA